MRTGKKVNTKKKSPPKAVKRGTQAKKDEMQTTDVNPAASPTPPPTPSPSLEVAIRVPYGIAVFLRQRRDPLSRKIATAMKAGGQREHWGPEMTLTRAELNTLATLAADIRKDSSSPVKLVSAANKMLAGARDAVRPPPPTPPALIPLDPVLSSVFTRPPQTLTTGSALDEAMSRLAAEQGVTETPSLPPVADTRQRVLMKLSTLYEILRVEKPGVAHILRGIIDEVKLI